MVAIEKDDLDKTQVRPNDSNLAHLVLRVSQMMSKSESSLPCLISHILKSKREIYVGQAAAVVEVETMLRCVMAAEATRPFLKELAHRRFLLPSSP